MKQPITLRLDPDLLARAKGVAKAENRTLTNFIETLLKHRIVNVLPSAPPADNIDHAPINHPVPQPKSKQPKKGADR